MEMFTGGASGSDYAWAKYADERKVNVTIMSFHGHKLYPIKDSANIKTKILAEHELAEASYPIDVASIFLDKNPPYKEFVRKLIQRNFWQVKESEAVFCIAEFDPANGVVLGGSGWACAMAIDLKLPIYIYSQQIGKWYYLSYAPIIVQFLEMRERPNINAFDRWTGIGTRKLEKHGRNEIKAMCKTIEMPINIKLEKMLAYFDD